VGMGLLLDDDAINTECFALSRAAATGSCQNISFSSLFFDQEVD